MCQRQTFLFHRKTIKVTKKCRLHLAFVLDDLNYKYIFTGKACHSTKNQYLGGTLLKTKYLAIDSIEHLCYSLETSLMEILF